MLCDECILACLIPIPVPIQALERLAMLDHQKDTGKTLSDAAYADIFKNYKEWIKEYVKLFMDGPFIEDVGKFKPHLAAFKYADAIKGYIKTVVSKLRLS
jgi:hypothetical protein